MSLRRVLFPFCLVISLVCLAAGYGMTAQWLGVGAVFLPILALLFSKKLAAAWLPPTCLVSLVCLAAVGLLEGAPTFLMILGTTAALAGWDLMNLDRSMEGSAPSETLRRFERKHALSLAIALGLGLLMTGSGKLFSLQIPFGLLILLVLFDLFSLDRVSRYLENRRARG